MGRLPVTLLLLGLFTTSVAAQEKLPARWDGPLSSTRNGRQEMRPKEEKSGDLGRQMAGYVRIKVKPIEDQEGFDPA